MKLFFILVIFKEAEIIYLSDSMALRFLFVDFNSYFASVEQQLRPELRGKPVAVVPMMAETTVCLAASYEAKKYGIKTGTMVREAKALCRDLIVVEARHNAYIEYHHKLFHAVDSCIPVHRVLSVDEMACELTGSQQQHDNAISIAKQIKETIADKVGTELRSSIGIAPNLFLSKTASDMQKPNGLVVIEEKDLPDCLYKLSPEDLTGIGRNMKQRLLQNGITTVKELCTADKAKLRKIWNGIEGDRMYAKLRGETVYDSPTHKSTVGHSHVLPPSLRTDEKAFAVLNRLLQKAAMRLRNYGYNAGGLYVGVRYLNGTRWREEMAFDFTQDTVQLINALTTLWSKKPAIASRPLKVSVTLFRLSESKNVTLSLFNFTKSSPEFNAALDKLNLRYGKNTVYFGGAHDALESAPMRIAFNHVPDLEIEGDE